MNKATITTAVSGGASVLGALNTWWMWFKADPSAHTIAILTGSLIASQLFWGWRKFFKGGM
ncbi:hypothetical protein [Burkholderia metallica]|uniref:hypothetical protein n=1 Tax=Burkholderia metallica TaxID=488729 RepID=UPI001CF5001A|nr:hypothetical protein [Burkholderia metallica]MCA8018065.1 hypothetical protein [Burkholderia metallica]